MATQAEKLVGKGSAYAGIYGPQVYTTMFDYSFAVSGEPAAGIAISKHSVPAGANVIGGWYKVTTTFTTAGADGGTVALSLVGANDLVTAIAVNDASNPWDLDLTGDKPLKRIATQLVAEKFVTITSATQLVTAGILIGVVYWVLPEVVSSGH